LSASRFCAFWLVFDRVDKDDHPKCILRVVRQRTMITQHATQIPFFGMSCAGLIQAGISRRVDVDCGCTGELQGRR
jgi:hypothetical protein